MFIRKLLLTAFVMVLFASTAQAQQDEDRARQVFARAEQLAADGQYQQALDLYEESLRLAPTGTAPLLGMGICLAALGRDEEALERFDEYLDRGRRPASRAQAEELARNATLRLGLGTLMIMARPPEAEVQVDGQDVPHDRRGRVRVPAGQHTIEARAEGFEDASQEITVAAGETLNVAIDLPSPASSSEPTSPTPVSPEPTPAEPPPDEAPPEDAPTPPPPTSEPTPPPAEPPPPDQPPSTPAADEPSLAGPWAVLGSGLGLLLTGAVLDIVAYSRSAPEGYDDLANLEDYDDWRQGAMNTALAGDVLVGLGAAATVGGLIWLLVARSRRLSGSTASPPISLALGRDGLAVQTRLHF